MATKNKAPQGDDNSDFQTVVGILNRAAVAVKAKRETAPPRSILVKPADALPSLPEAFARWQGLGEWPADAVLCEFVGSMSGPETHRDTASGKRVNPETWETLTDLWFQTGKKSGKAYQIFRPVSENAG